MYKFCFHIVCYISNGCNSQINNDNLKDITRLNNFNYFSIIVSSSLPLSLRISSSSSSYASSSSASFLSSYYFFFFFFFIPFIFFFIFLLLHFVPLLLLHSMLNTCLVLLIEITNKTFEYFFSYP